MKEVQPGAGQHISAAMKRLAAEAASGPAFSVFNGIRVEARPGDTAEALCERWSADSEKRRREYEASPEYRERERQALAEQERASKTIADAMATLWRLDFGDIGAVLAWIASFAEATDRVGVDNALLLKEMPECFARHGLVPNMNCGAAFVKGDRVVEARWLVGQALSFLTEPPFAIHGAWIGLYAKWKSQHAAS